MAARVVVVGAALFAGGRLLAARRVAPAALAGGWELPGGKVDPGETDEEALVRELHEELGVSVQLVERVPGEWPLGDTADEQRCSDYFAKQTRFDPDIWIVEIEDRQGRAFVDEPIV